MSLLRNALSPGRRSEGRALSETATDSARSPERGAPSRGRALLIAPSWVGDAILSEALVAELRQGGGAESVDVVAPPWCAPVYARMRGIRDILDAPAGHGALALRARRALGRRLRERRYAKAYVLPNTWKSALVPFFAGVPERIGYVGELRFGLLTDARPLDRKALPQLVARYAALARPRDVPPASPGAPKLVANEANLRSAMQALALSRERPIAILCPGAEFGPAKRWPAEHFAQLCALLDSDGYGIWIVGSPNEAAIAKAVLAALPSTAPQVIDLTGRTDLGTAIDLMSIASLVVSNDSGLMHAAAAVDAPLVALFGSSSPAYTPPLSQGARVAKIDIACSPCFKRECPLGHFRCMRDLSPELVYNLARAARRI